MTSPVLGPPPPPPVNYGPPPAPFPGHYGPGPRPLPVPLGTVALPCAQTELFPLGFSEAYCRTGNVIQ